MTKFQVLLNDDDLDVTLASDMTFEDIWNRRNGVTYYQTDKPKGLLINCGCPICDCDFGRVIEVDEIEHFIAFLQGIVNATGHDHA